MGGSCQTAQVQSSHMSLLKWNLDGIMKRLQVTFAACDKGRDGASNASVNPRAETTISTLGFQQWAPPCQSLVSPAPCV